MDTWKIFAIAIALALLVIALSQLSAAAHESPLGMRYPTDCCSTDGRECGPISAQAVKETKTGYLVTIGQGGHHNAIYRGAVKRFDYQSEAVRPSTDGLTHACMSKQSLTQLGQIAGGTIYCLILPPRGF